MLTLLSLTAGAATPYAGLEWTPLGRSDLAWVDAGEETGLLVGAGDGFVRPDLLAYGGAWLTRRIGVHGALGVARLQTTTWSGDTWIQVHEGVVRPAADVRVALLRRDDRRPIPWLFAGAHVDLPSARDTSNGYTDEEQQAADETATEDRIRLGAVGARIGAGADAQVVPFLRLGLQWGVDWQQSLWKSGDPEAVTSFVSAEAALLVELHWTRPPAPAEG